MRPLLLCIQHLSIGELPSQRYSNKLTSQQWKYFRLEEARDVAGSQSLGFFNGPNGMCLRPKLGQIPWVRFVKCCLDKSDKP